MMGTDDYQSARPPIVVPPNTNLRLVALKNHVRDPQRPFYFAVLDNIAFVEEASISTWVASVAPLAGLPNDYHMRCMWERQNSTCVDAAFSSWSSILHSGRTL